MERERAWAKANGKDKAEIARVNAESMERARAEAEARVRDKTYYFQKAAAEVAAKIRYKVGS